MERARKSRLEGSHARWRRWSTVGVAALLVVAAVDLPLAHLASNHLQQERGSLRLTWARDQQDGVAAAALTNLRRALDRAQGQPWWSPGFWWQSQQATLSHLQHSTTETWTKALDQSRHTAELYLTEYRNFVGQNTAWLSLDEQHQESGWSAELAQASTPGKFSMLAARWKSDLSQAQRTAKASEAAAAAAVTAANGTSGLLGQATALEAAANSDRLSLLRVPPDATLLQQALASGKSGTAETSALSQQLSELRAEIGLDQQVTDLNQTVLGLVDQAAFEQTPGCSSFLSQYQAADSALKAAQTVAQMGAVQVTLEAIQQGVQPVLAANQCGHTAYGGKSIYISISLEEMIFYDNGCVVNATPVTTGRPQLPTPTGTFSIFLKQSPVEFISSYPPSSPYYYSPVLIQYAMEFLAGGYYIHSAQWETNNDFGPGSQSIPAYASHGCVHAPTSVMAWAYSWTPDGTPVVVSA